MKVICNTSPIIGLMAIDRLPLLWTLFEQVIIPEAVYKELCADVKKHKFETEKIEQCVKEGKLKVYQIENHQMVKSMYGKLHYGELEVIVGAKELNLPLAIIDEIAARKMASEFLIDTIGLVGMLIYAKKTGILKEIRSDMEMLRSKGYRISDKIFFEALKSADEL